MQHSVLVEAMEAHQTVEDLTNEDFSVWNRGLNVFMPVFNAGKLLQIKDC